MSKKLNPRLEAFLNSLKDALNDPVIEWFALARQASQATYKSTILQQCFLAGAIPEVFNLDQYYASDLKSRTAYNQRMADMKWRMDNAPDIGRTWFKEFYFHTAEGTVTKYRLPLDRKIITDFSLKVIARRKSFS